MDILFTECSRVAQRPQKRHFGFAMSQLQKPSNLHSSSSVRLFEEMIDHGWAAEVFQEHRRQALNLSQGVLSGTRYQLPKCERRKPPTFYSLDGEEIVAYDIEVNTDDVQRQVRPSDHVTDGEHGENDNRNKTSTCPLHRPIPRYAYSESLGEDIIENFDLVMYADAEASHNMIHVDAAAKRSSLSRSSAIQSNGDDTPNNNHNQRRITAGQTKISVVSGRDRLEREKRSAATVRCNNNWKIPSFLCDSGVAPWFRPLCQSSTAPTLTEELKMAEQRKVSASHRRRAVKAAPVLSCAGERNSPAANLDPLSRSDNRNIGLMTNGMASSKIAVSKLWTPDGTRVSSVVGVLREVAVTVVDDVIEGIHDIERRVYQDDDQWLDDASIDCETLATASTTLYDLVNTSDNVCLALSKRLYRNQLSK